MPGLVHGAHQLRSVWVLPYVPGPPEAAQACLSMGLEQVWRNNEGGVLAVEATEGLSAVLAKRHALEQGLGDARYHRIIHVRNAAVSALREVRRKGFCAAPCMLPDLCRPEHAASNGGSCLLMSTRTNSECQLTL